MDAKQLTKYAQKYSQGFALSEQSFLEFIKKAFMGADVYYSNYMDDLTIIGIYGDGDDIIREFSGSVPQAVSKDIYDINQERLKAHEYTMEEFYDWMDRFEEYRHSEFIALEASRTREGIYIVSNFEDNHSRSASVLLDVALDSLARGNVGMPSVSIIRQYTKRD